MKLIIGTECFNLILTKRKDSKYITLRIYDTWIKTDWLKTKLINYNSGSILFIAKGYGITFTDADLEKLNAFMA